MYDLIIYTLVGFLLGIVCCLLWVSWQDAEFHDDYADEQMELGINKNRSENKETANG